MCSNLLLTFRAVIYQLQSNGYLRRITDVGIQNSQMCKKLNHYLIPFIESKTIINNESIHPFSLFSRVRGIHVR